MKPGDKVLIARQPSNQWVKLQGEKGIINEIHGDFAEITTYSDNDWWTAKGWGTVPLDCLELLK
ncbi:hypothetical protein LCGC14_2710460 [marine sediment metagenome]|uniref:KOW domain-containing protein n=1 Tax=marine sediment metagenome TaxID=412755 RepID=A0A0F9BM28_9ZZZZ